MGIHFKCLGTKWHLQLWPVTISNMSTTMTKVLHAVTTFGHPLSLWK